MKTLFLLAFIPCFVLAKPKNEPEYLKISKVKAAAVLLNGKAGDAIITATVGIGLHVQANPASQPNLVATQLTLDGNDSFEVGPVVYPPSKPYRLQNSDRDLQTYDGTFEIKVPLKAIPTKAKIGKNEINAKLRYQACNDKICFFPTSAKLVIPITVYK